MISEERTEVVVVGGGISGLSAAVTLEVRSIFELHCLGKKQMFLLEEAGIQVVLLEARQRLGGRICTVEVGESKSINFDQHELL